MGIDVTLYVITDGIVKDVYFLGHRSTCEAIEQLAKKGNLKIKQRVTKKYKSYDNPRKTEEYFDSFIVDRESLHKLIADDWNNENPLALEDGGDLGSIFLDNEDPKSTWQIRIE